MTYETFENVKKNLKQNSRTLVYRGAGLEDLLDDAKLVKPVFDDFCNSILGD